MAKKTGPITAGELLEKLANDPEYQARIAERDRVFAEREAALAREEQPLLADLRSVGLNLESVWDLVNTSDRYPNAVPVLLAHLDRPYSERTREGIVRALTVREARGIAGQRLIAAFRQERDPDLRWVIGLALAGVATADDLDGLTPILADKSYGHSRSMLLHALARLCGLAAVPSLIDFLADPDMAPEAIITLGKLKAKDAREHIEPFLEHEESWVRGEARKALKKIGK